MKKLAAIIGLCALSAGAFAQGLVTFFPTTTTLSSVNNGTQTSTTSGAAGSWYYGLLTAPVGSTTFTFTGNYATNLATAGLFGSLAPQAVNGWAAGATNTFEVAVWSSSLGHNFNANWLNNSFGGAQGFFGLSGKATAASGGAGSPATPPLALFGGANGIQTGPLATPTTIVPEPSSMALAGLGAAALLIFRRRK